VTTQDESIDQAVAAGRITEHDAAEIRRFRAFLVDTAGIPTRAADRTPEQQTRFVQVYREHYPEDFARHAAEQRARQAAR
jgi:hypothetical protein